MQADNYTAINPEKQANTVYTVAANCQDCYRCVRVCPVKAISVHNGQARVEDELCIKCGTCVKECPQHAKTIRTSLDTVKSLLASGVKVAASVAPSFAAVFSGWQSTRLPSALKLLGFSYVSETAEGAKLVTEESLKLTDRCNICTTCPALVNYLKTYRPECLDLMIPIVSPMIAHGRLLKKRLGPDYAVVFIGPCAAKKEEAMWPENKDVIDAVLTFSELQDWLTEEEINLANCSESGFESYGDLEKARLFPLQGGMLKTGNLSCEETNYDIIHISGPDDVINFFNMDKKDLDFTIIEAMFCKGGCINGPGIATEKNVFLRKQNVLSYAAKANKIKGDLEREVDCRTSFTKQPTESLLIEVDENHINQVFEATGKSNPELQLNCGACGYGSCRDNAIAVVRGLAEPEMCIPYMRRLAQQSTDKIIEASPNGVVILNKDLHIINMNPAFQKLFTCNNGILGRHISYLVDADGYEKLAAGSVTEYEAIKSKYGIKYHEQIYYLGDEQQYVGMYTDVSKIKFDGTQIDLIKKNTIDQAKELLDHQIRFSQEMAHYLGKSTARSEELVKQLIELYDEDN